MTTIAYDGESIAYNGNSGAIENCHDLRAFVVFATGNDEDIALAVDYLDSDYFPLGKPYLNNFEAFLIDNAKDVWRVNEDLELEECAQLSAIGDYFEEAEQAMNSGLTAEQAIEAVEQLEDEATEIRVKKVNRE